MSKSTKERVEEILTSSSSLPYGISIAFNQKILGQQQGLQKYGGDELKDKLTTTLEELQQEKEEAVKEERERWLQILPEETFSITIEGKFDKRVLAIRKFVSMTSIQATDGRTLLLEAEASAHQIIKALTHPKEDMYNERERIEGIYEGGKPQGY